MLKSGGFHLSRINLPNKMEKKDPGVISRAFPALVKRNTRLFCAPFGQPRVQLALFFVHDSLQTGAIKGIV